MSVKGFFRFFACLVLVNMYGITVNGTPDKLICYFDSLSLFRPLKERFPIHEFPPNLCTHLIYASISVTFEGTILIIDESLDVSRWQGAFDAFKNLKKANPHLKTLVSMGGTSSKLSSIFSDADKRKTFAQHAAKFLKKYGFDGMDLNWKYPAQNGGVAGDKRNFVDLCNNLNVEFSANQYLLTAAVAPTNINQSYDVPNLVKYVDFFNLMAFAEEATAGHNALINTSNAEKTSKDFDNVNVEASVKMWINQGVPASKLILGMPLFGRSFTLSPSWFCNSTPTVRCNLTRKGHFKSIVKYNKICLEMIQPKNESAILWWDDRTSEVYYISENQWVSHESLSKKMDIIFENNLGGGMVWSIDSDDFSGACGLGKYPLLQDVSQRLLN